MSKLLESPASSEPTPPGPTDPTTVEPGDNPPVAAEEPPQAPDDPLEDIQKRPHPFAD